MTGEDRADEKVDIRIGRDDLLRRPEIPSTVRSRWVRFHSQHMHSKQDLSVSDTFAMSEDAKLMISHALSYSSSGTSRSPTYTGRNHAKDEACGRPPHQVQSGVGVNAPQCLSIWYSDVMFWFIIIPGFPPHLCRAQYHQQWMNTTLAPLLRILTLRLHGQLAYLKLML